MEVEVVVTGVAIAANDPLELRRDVGTTRGVRRDRFDRQGRGRLLEVRPRREIL